MRLFLTKNLHKLEQSATEERIVLHQANPQKAQEVTEDSRINLANAKEFLCSNHRNGQTQKSLTILESQNIHHKNLGKQTNFSHPPR